LKQIVGELKLPRSMGLIVRTAGLQRTKPEIKRDFDYLARLWDEIREKTLKSTAPALIHSDSDLIKRAIRDIYNREIEEVVVEGEEGYRAAREFMKLLMPSHARRVKAYSDPVPLFQRYGAEDQLSAMYDPVVQLKSGGYLVINPTEALVSIDINSGRSTKEHGIEQTALNTNLEAAREIARHLRLRDMAGLVVIDFIDMEYGSNVRKVEKAMKEALKNDRARIQIGRISGFGLMEMSRQRLRTGVLEATTRQCPHCDGTGLVRTASSAGLSALRLIEDEAAKGKGTTITLYASTEAAIYLLNAKRADLAAIEQLYGVTVEVVPEGEEEGAKMRVTSSGPRPTSLPRFEPIVDEIEDYDLTEDEEEEEDEEEARGAGEDGDNRRGKRRRRRGGRGRNRERQDSEERVAEDAAEADEVDEPTEAEAADEDSAERPKKRRRRGGRRRNKNREGLDDGTSNEEVAEEAENIPETAEGPGTADQPVAGASEEAAASETPKRRTRRKKAVEEAIEQAPVAEDEPSRMAPTGEEAPLAEAETKPKRRSRAKKPAASEVEAPTAAGADTEAKQAAAETGSADPVTAKDPEPAKPKRSRRKPAATEGESAVEPEPAKPAPKPSPSAANDANGDNGAAEEPAAPRRGWWQRTFGE
jgi:ribonuclease E